MAKNMTTRKTTSNSTTKTSQPAETMVKEVTTETEKEVGVVETNTKPEKRTFKPDDGIMCRSVTVGGLWLDGIKSGNIYRWVEYGDETEVDYRDLVAMIRSRSKYIFNPNFIIVDTDFVEEFPQLKKFYSDQYTVSDLRGVLDLPVNTMVDTIKSLPPGAIASLKNIASTEIVNGHLDSVKKIKALDSIFGTELNLLASLFQ